MFFTKMCSKIYPSLLAKHKKYTPNVPFSIFLYILFDICLFIANLICT